MAIALVDCNSFYCSCERLFRPDLRDRPVVVLSNNDGCAIARTPEAKALGIKMGEPYFKIKELCKKHDVHIFSSNFSLYTNISDRVMLSLSEFTDYLEIYSVDEAFLNLKGFEHIDLHDYATTIKETIGKNIGIPVGVGVGPTKVLAKIANHLAKKSKIANGVVVLMEKRLQDIALQRVMVEDIWGIGAANSAKMRSLGIKTALDFRDYKNERLILKKFTKTGLQIQKELQGVACFDLDNSIQKKKEIMCSRTFGGNVSDLFSLRESIASYTSLACEKLRAQKSVCGKLEIFFRTNSFNNTAQDYVWDSHQLLTPTLDTFKLIKIAEELVKKNFKEGYAYKKAGVKLSSLFDENNRQLSLLETNQNADRIKLMQVIDNLNKREGTQVIKSLACGVDNTAWKMLRHHKSQAFTTSWDELRLINSQDNKKS